jgi:hypothetical protein
LLISWYLTAVEWEFVQGLAYREQTQDDADFVQLIYTSQLRKYKHTEEHALTRRRLVEEFGLSDNPDVLFSFADVLYTQFRWADCYVITTRSECLSRGVEIHLRSLNVFTGYWGWFLFTILPCHCTLLACTILTIFIQNSLF